MASIRGNDYTKCDPKDLPKFERKTVAEFNEIFKELGVEDFVHVSKLFNIAGWANNIEYDFNGEKKKLLNDNEVYLGNQIEDPEGDYYGLVADDKMLFVSKFGENAQNPKILVYRKR